MVTSDFKNHFFFFFFKLKRVFFFTTHSDDGPIKPAVWLCLFSMVLHISRSLSVVLYSSLLLHIFKADVWTVPLPLSDSAQADGRSWSAGMLTLLPSAFMAFRCVSLPSCWVQSSMVLSTRDLCRSNSVGLISYTHKRVTKSCFSCRAAPLYSLPGLIDAALLKRLT